METDKADELNFLAKLEQFKQLHETQRSLIKSVGTFGIQALKGIFLLNGGGAIAVLAHVTAAKDHPYSVLYFAYAALAAVASTGSAYLTEFFGAIHFNKAASRVFSDSTDEKTSDGFYRTMSVVFLILAIILFMVSCILFAAQVYGIAESFREFDAAKAVQ